MTDLLPYVGCIGVSCSRCGAQPGKPCINPVGGRERRYPCQERVRLAESGYEP